MESINGMKVLYYSGNEIGKTFELPAAEENTLAIVRAGGKTIAVNNILNAEVPKSPGFKMIHTFKTEMFLYKNGNWIWLPPEVSLDDMMYYVSELTNDINAVDEKADANAENISTLSNSMNDLRYRITNNTNDIESLDTRMSAAEVITNKLNPVYSAITLANESLTLMDSYVYQLGDAVFIYARIKNETEETVNMNAGGLLMSVPNANFANSKGRLMSSYNNRVSFASGNGNNIYLINNISIQAEYDFIVTGFLFKNFEVPGNE